MTSAARSAPDFAQHGWFPYEDTARVPLLVRFEATRERLEALGYGAP